MKPFNAAGAFQVEQSGNELGRSAARGAGVSIFSSGVGLAIQMIATVILVRLLTPGDFGLVGLVSTFSLLLMNFGVNGFTEAIIQRETIDEALTSNLFWISIGSGLLLSVGFASSGLLLARFYNNPRVVGVAAGMSVSIFLASTSVQHLALLKRAMLFRLVSANDVVARIVSVAVSLICALLGWGYWSLVVGVVMMSFSTSIGGWLLCRWIPSLPRAAVGTRSMMSYSLHVYGRFSVNYLSRNVDNLLVGWRFGAVSLGFYKKAYDLFVLPVSQLVLPVSDVLLSTLSRMDPRSSKYREHYLSALSILAFIGMALGADLTLVGKDIIRLLLGPKWDVAGRIFTSFGPGIGIMIVYHTHGPIHLSIGRADRWLRWTLVEVMVTCSLFLLSLRWGVEGIAAAWAVSFWILTIPALWYAGHPIGFRVGSMIGEIWRYVLAALVAGSVSKAVMSWIPSLALAPNAVGAAERLVIVSLMVCILYLGAVVCLYGGWKPLYRMAWVLNEMMPKTKFFSPTRVASDVVAAPVRDEPTGVGTDTPLVSILIPAYNSEQWIADTLRSAIRQTWPRTEIIVVDDGSTDRTLEIIRKFESDGVRVLSQKNAGASAARNHAYAQSSGEYIQWLDADDLLAPDKIALQMAAIQKLHGKKILFSSPFGLFTHRYYQARFHASSLWRDLSPAEWLRCKFRDNAYMQTATWLVSRELTEAAGKWDTRLLGDDDGEYFCRVVLASEAVLFVPEAKVYYRTPAHKSLSYIGMSVKKMNAHWLSIRLHVDYLRSLDDNKATREACLHLLQTNYIYFYPEMSDLVLEVQGLAKELGGELVPPSLSWKYRWIRIIFGWGAAKRVWILAPRFMWVLRRSWDKLLFLAHNLIRLDPTVEPARPAQATKIDIAG